MIRRVKQHRIFLGLPGGQPSDRSDSGLADHAAAVRRRCIPYNRLNLYTRALPGQRLRKTRHRLAAQDGVTVSVDRFEGALSGLILAEAEFETADALQTFPTPDFAVREVTDDPRYNGGALIRDGLPT